MITSISDKSTQDVYDGLNSKAARKIPRELHVKARRLLDLLNAVIKLDDLRIPPSNKLEALRGEWNDFYSIRINDQWRIIFQWKEGDAYKVRIIDYHK